MENNDPRSTTEGQNSAPESAEKPRVEKKRTFWSRVRKIAVLLLLIILILCFAVGLFIQLPVFKRLVVNELVSAIENSTNGTLTVGEIKGNILEGFVMEDVSLRLKTGTKYDSIPLVHVNKIIANYSLWRWIKTNEIGITSMTLEHPVIHFIKFQGDTTWNYSLLTKPVPTAPKGPPKPFTQIIDLSRLLIQDGSFYMRDYNFAPKQEATLQARSANPSEPAIDWKDVEVEELDLDSRFYARGDQMQSARVHHLGFIEKKSGFYVSHLEFSGYLDSLQAKMEGVKITTRHSAIGFSLEVSKPKAIDLSHFSTTRHTNVHLNLEGPVISTAELKQFDPWDLDFLGSSPSLTLNANGEFGRLKIDELNLGFRNTGSITIAGELDNLHHPDSLAMNIRLTAKDLSNNTLNNYVPGLHLPNLTRFGTIEIPKLTYIGEPLDFHTTFATTTTGAGNASGDVILDLRNKHIQYKAGVQAQHFNVAALAPGHESSITADARLAGHGTNWKTMTSTVAVKTDGPSSFESYNVTSLDLVGAIDRGTISTEHLDAIIAGGPTVHVKQALLGLSSPSIPFQFDGTVDSLRLGEIIPSQSLNPARIDFAGTLSGFANQFDRVTGTAHIRLYDMEYQGHPIPEDSASIAIVPTGPDEQKLSFQSGIADVSIAGEFQTGDLAHAVPEHIHALIAAIGHREFPEPEPVRFPIPKCDDSLNFQYSIQIKDLRPLADFMPQTFLMAHGTIAGSVQGCENGNISLSAKSDSLSFLMRERTSIDSSLVESFDTTFDSLSRDSSKTKSWIVMHRKDSAALALPKFSGSVPRIQAMPTSFQLTLENLSLDSARLLEHLHASLSLSTDSVLRLGSALLYRPRIDMKYLNESLQFHASTLYGNELGVLVSGNATFPAGNLDLTVDTVNVAYTNPYFTPENGELRDYVWHNSSPANLVVSNNGVVRLDTLHIIHPLSAIAKNPSVQQLNIGGTISGDTIAAFANVPSFRLEDLRKILPFNPNAKTFDFASYHGKVRDFQVSLNGTLEEPEMGAKLFIDSMSYGSEGENRITFDSNYVNLSYKNDELRGTMHIHVDTVQSSAPNGLIAGYGHRSELVANLQSIPIVIAFKHGEEYSADSARAATAPVSANIQATEFPLDIVTPFLPVFRQILGTGDINFTISGTRNAMQYAGQASIRDGAVLLDATNMWYLFGGPITFAHNALVLQNDSVRNIPSDDAEGAASLNGSFTFNGFDVTNFDLRLRSNGLLVLSDAAKVSLPMAYGPVKISTGGGDFHFYNTFEAPKISGTIDILSANVTMPSGSNETQSVTGEGVIYETLPRVSQSETESKVPASQPLKDSTSEHASSNETDTLFPDSMTDIFRNDDGTVQTVTAPEETTESNHANPLAPRFVDKLRMDLTVNTRGTASITIPFGGQTFGVIGAKMTADLKPGGTLKIERGDDLAPATANGGFELSQNSTFTFLKSFTITDGRVKFTNDFTNPGVDVTADYIGIHHPANGAPTDNVKVEIQVLGTKDQPIISIQNYEQYNGNDWELKSEPSAELAQEDAIDFLLTGQFKNEVAGNSAALSNLPATLGGQMLANIVSDLAGSTSSQFAIQSASLNLGSRGAQVTAAYKNITFKLAGGEASTTGPGGIVTYQGLGYNLESDFSLTAVPWLSNQTWTHNFTIQLQYNQNPSSTLGALTQQPVFLGKIIFDLSKIRF